MESGNQNIASLDSVAYPVMIVDLGTTTLAGRLLASSGAVLAEASLENPQIEHSADVLARLDLAHEGKGGLLQSLLIAGVNRLIANLVREAGVAAEDVGGVVVAGNPAMSCLFHNLPVESLLFPPHKPVFKEMLTRPSSELGLDVSGHVWTLPQVSGFVGGDLVACLLGLGDVSEGTVVVDLGTNAEIGLWDGRRWWVTSAAAGPAFEAGNISTGMVHGLGAVTDVNLDGDTIRCLVRDGGAPRGLCGSGLLALVAAALQGGLIAPDGAIRNQDDVETNLGRYLVEKDGGLAISYYRDASTNLLLTQEDVRSVQLAKAAVRAGVFVLLEKAGFSAAQVPRVYLAGALGVNAAKTALKRVALLPEPMVDKTSFIDNGVLTGLQSFLGSSCQVEVIERLVERMQPFPLSGTPAFEKHYMTSINF